jgi:hypothetical protein
MLATYSVTMTRRGDHGQCPKRRGSGCVTSRTAPDNCPDSNALRKSSSTRCRRRPRSTSPAPRRRFSKTSQLRTPSVWRVRGNKKTSISDRARKRGQSSVPENEKFHHVGGPSCSNSRLRSPPHQGAHKALDRVARDQGRGPADRELRPIGLVTNGPRQLDSRRQIRTAQTRKSNGTSSPVRIHLLASPKKDIETGSTEIRMSPAGARDKQKH